MSVLISASMDRLGLKYVIEEITDVEQITDILVDRDGIESNLTDRRREWLRKGCFVEFTKETGWCFKILKGKYKWQTERVAWIYFSYWIYKRDSVW